MRRKAVWRRGEAIFLLEKAVDIQNFLRPARPTMDGGHISETLVRLRIVCIFSSLRTMSRRVEIADSCIEITYIIEITREITLETREITQR